MAKERVMITFLGDQETKEKLDDLAKLHDRNRSNLLRLLIKREWNEANNITQNPIPVIIVNQEQTPATPEAA